MKTNESKTFGKMVWPNHPKLSSGTNMQADENLWHIIRPRHPAQPSGRKNRLTGEPFGEKKRKKSFGKMIWPSLPAKHSSGTHMKLTANM